MPLTIAMDGPVGAGKSTIADVVAARLGILHLDTGAMYRAVGLSALRQGVPLEDEQALTELCARLRLEVAYDARGQVTCVNGEDVSGLIRTEEVSMATSAVSRVAGVRRAMVALQQQLAAETPMLLDGRDIGTRVLPNATVKIYLTADAKERARRRYEQLRAKGVEADYACVLEDLLQRDAQDMNRAVDPLRVAEDAVVVDTTNLTFEQTVDAIVNLIKERIVPNE